jgi:hypothetical protein
VYDAARADRSDVYFRPPTAALLTVHESVTTGTTTELLLPDMNANPEATRARRPAGFRSRAVLIVAACALVYACATILSMRQTSTTFDEIIMSSSGARGYVTGDFDMIVLYHPRVMTYLYGLPLLLSHPTYPPESRDWSAHGASFAYARELYFGHGNNGPMLAFRARLIAVLVGVGLIFLVFAFVRRYYGDVPAVLAAGMTAFLPDLLGHGGISYNDVPNALVFFAAVWGLDRAASKPTVRTAVVAGMLVALALGVKYSAVALAPIALCLLVIAAVAEGRAWRTYVRRVVPLLPVAALALYVGMVVIYLGDFTLASFRQGLAFNLAHATRGHGVPALLMGEQSVQGFWYFFPLAFLIKTPAALHILLAIASLGLFVVRPERHGLLRSPLRGPVVALLIFLAFLLRSDLNIGFRHALPTLPLAIVIGAVGLGRLWSSQGRTIRLTIAALLVVQAASVLSWFPHFIPYTSEYTSYRDIGFGRLSDSSHDWGQGLPLLRDFMKQEGVATVYLSYFGSAVPEAYGINYVPMQSFFPLQPLAAPADTAPRFAAISATNLSGAYVADRFARFRRVLPYRVLGHSVFIFEVNPNAKH